MSHWRVESGFSRISDSGNLHPQGDYVNHQKKMTEKWKQKQNRLDNKAFAA